MIPPSTRLRRAIHASDAPLVARMLKSHPSHLHNPDASLTGQSNSNLHLAASLGHRSVCQVLLDAGHERPCPALNERNQTALMLAARAGHADVVHLLCEADANASLGMHHTGHDSDGDSNNDILNGLNGNGSGNGNGNKDEQHASCLLRRDTLGRDAIMEASLNGHDTVLQILLTYIPGGPLSAVRRSDIEGNTALHFASSNGNLLVLRTLLAAGADVEKRNAWNWTPAAYSATVQAEVYLKGLVSEVSSKKQQQQAVRKEARASVISGGSVPVNIDPGKMAGGVRVVADDSDDD